MTAQVFFLDVFFFKKDPQLNAVEYYINGRWKKF